VALFTVWTAADVQTAQQQLLASANETNTGAAACSAIDGATKTEWATWLAAVTAFCNQVPVYFATSDNEVSVFFAGSRADQLQEYQKELQAWQTKFAATKGCSFPPGLQIADAGGQLLSALKIAVTGIAFVAAAVIVTKVAREVELFRPKSEVAGA
jgi:hypothetical protein